MMFPWRTVGLHTLSYSSPATCAQRVDVCQRPAVTKQAHTISGTMVFFSTFEELTLPIKGPMEDAGVVKLYEPSPTQCLYVAKAENMVGRILLIPCFLHGNATPTIPHKYSKKKSAYFPDGCADAAARMEGEAATSMRLLLGCQCGSLDVVSLALAV